MQHAYFSSSVSDFLKEKPEAVLGHLAAHHPHELTPLQRTAWIAQIKLLQQELASTYLGWIALEYAIPRMGKRADAVLLAGGIIFVIEFKIWADIYSASALDQVTDYALDLKNFHAGSHARRIVPIVVATDAAQANVAINWRPDDVADPLLCNGSNLGAAIAAVLTNTSTETPLEYSDWTNSGYRPTPTIIEAAQALYAGHKVEEITRSDAGAKNLSLTTQALARIIEGAKTNRQKAICFVTGVPGAGKTLAGLNLVTQRSKTNEEEHAVFLSGNGPLVEVLREALARDEQEQSKARGNEISKVEALRKVKSFIQNIHHFRDDGLRTEKPPIEHVSIFDEAQRAWDRDHTENFMKQRKGIANFDKSEPEFLIEVMDRHTDWCAIVCLVGGGQEINAGEAGLTEWFHALCSHFPKWLVYTSPVLAHRDYHWGQDLSEMLQGRKVEIKPDLHLAVSVRSFRAEQLSEFVGAIVAGEASEAVQFYREIKDRYPIALTRDLNTAREWLRARARGSERFGLVASSGASRLKAEGINVHEKIVATDWFLNTKQDVRSCYYLEDPATEFDIQGLELDWIGVCWDADLRTVNGTWSYHKFRGTVWQNVNSAAQRTYLVNAYRVLMTRARQGMIIYVPRGNANDPTRLPEFYDGTAAFLQSCGVTNVV